MEFHKALANARKKCNLTQHEVAEFIGVETSTYAHYELGNRKPDIDKLVKLHEKLGICVEAAFPIERTVQFPQKTIMALERVKKNAEAIIDELKKCDPKDIKQWMNMTRDCCLEMQTAIDEGQKVVEEAFSTNGLDEIHVECPITILRVTDDLYGWKLLTQCMDLYTKLLLPPYQAASKGNLT